LLGSNLGDRGKNLDDAVSAIDHSVGKVVQKSHFYLTEAWGKSGQPDFYNQVILVETIWNPLQVLDRLLEIEKGLGRERFVKWEARLIDIDILFCGDLVMDSERLKLPHPLIAKRNFTLVPLLELAPDLVHPTLGKTIQELYIETLDPLEVLMLDTNG
jgi:2-amino-4-hydroxy-6-hydroxymethyldihydropteridine diphosphokinase